MELRAGEQAEVARGLRADAGGVRPFRQQADLAEHRRRRDGGEHLIAAVLEDLHGALDQHHQALWALALLEDDAAGLGLHRHHGLEDLLGLLVREAAAEHAADDLARLRWRHAVSLTQSYRHRGPPIVNSSPNRENYFPAPSRLVRVEARM